MNKVLLIVKIKITTKVVVDVAAVVNVVAVDVAAVATTSRYFVKRFNCDSLRWASPDVFSTPGSFLVN